MSSGSQANGKGVRTLTVSVTVCWVPDLFVAAVVAVTPQSVNPQNITVKSSLGGSATANTVAK